MLLQILLGRIDIDLNNLWGTYGTSHMGEPLRYYRIGTGRNVLFVVFQQHGFEDGWSRDGRELVRIGNDLARSLRRYSNRGLFNDWTVYVVPSANPDSLVVRQNKQWYWKSHCCTELT